MKRNKIIKEIKLKITRFFQLIPKFFNRSIRLLSEQFGINFSKFFISFKNIPRYIRDYLYFKSSYDGNLVIDPYLSDFSEDAGDSVSEYFINDLFLAQKVIELNPTKIIDIGSRVDGYVAHIATSRSIEICDIRKLSCNSKNIKYIQMDITKKINTKYYNYSDFVSSIHAIEHFGLGRYGDEVNEKGMYEGLKNIVLMLKTNGFLILSIPLGQDTVYFNSHRIVNPYLILNFMNTLGLEINEFVYLYKGKIISTNNYEDSFNKILERRYTLGTFIMKKL